MVAGHAQPVGLLQPRPAQWRQVLLAVGWEMLLDLGLEVLLGGGEVVAKGAAVDAVVVLLRLAQSQTTIELFPQYFLPDSSYFLLDAEPLDRAALPALCGLRLLEFLA